MKQARNVLLVVALLGFSFAGCSSDSKSATGPSVNVDLRDAKGSDHWSVSPDSSSVSAGTVTFDVKNSGTIEHEMVVLKTDEAADKLAIASDDRVSEDTSIGEVSEFPAGKTLSVTLDMAAGSYVLVCNIAGHYGKGMRTAFTVT